MHEGNEPWRERAFAGKRMPPPFRQLRFIKITNFHREGATDPSLGLLYLGLFLLSTSFMLLSMEMATTSPPFGLSLFILKGVRGGDTTMGDVYKSALPYLCCDLIVMMGLLIYPGIALWLPGLMR